MMFRLNKFVCLVCFLSFFSSFAYVQSYDEYLVLKKENPDADTYYTNLEDHIRLFYEKGKLKIMHRSLRNELYLTEQSKGRTERSISYSDLFNDIKSIEAYSLVPNGKKYSKIKVEDFIISKSTNSDVFYDDQNTKSFHFQGLTPGAYTFYTYEQEIKDPKFIFPVFLKEFSPAKRNSGSIKYPSNVALRYKIFGDTAGMYIKLQTKTHGSETQMTWEVNHTAALAYEGSAYNVKYYAPHIIFWIENYVLDGKIVPVCTDIKQLYKTNYDLIKEVQAEESALIKNTADSICKGATTELDKLKRLYYFTQNHIKYIAFEDRMGGYVPRYGSEVLTKRFGDCKDKANLLRLLLKTQNIPAYLTWIGTRDIPYGFQELPTNSLFNHMIAATRINNEWVFLDGTAEDHSLYVVPSHIQGKEALISIAADSFVVAKVPVAQLEHNFYKDDIRLSIDKEDVLHGTYDISFGGNWKTRMVGYISSLTDKDKEKEIQGLCQEGNNKSSAVLREIKGLKDRDTTLFLGLDFTLPSYIRKVDQKMYINLNYVRHLESEEIDISKRKLAIENDFPYYFEATLRLKIPNGYTCTYLPEKSNYDNPDFGFDFNYFIDKNEVVLVKRIALKYTILDTKKFQDWNTMIDMIKSNYKESIVLEPIKK